jgi:phosphopantothenoylcysteine synthetase/decarboxylase
MRCIVTAGPTFEPLDEVRRLTNFSTGRLGTELANFLQAAGGDVSLLFGEQSTWTGPVSARNVIRFGSTAQLSDELESLSTQEPIRVFHTSAVSDFSFGKIWASDPDGIRRELTGGKISTRAGELLAELIPTPKLIRNLRVWYPNAFLVGWKYEVDGDRDEIVRKAMDQILENKTDLAVANGPAYGNGFGVVDSRGEVTHFEDREGLFEFLSAQPGRS